LKRTRERDSSSVFFISKWVIIVAIVIVSSLSFILGYYVGKRALPSDQNQLSIVPTENTLGQKDTEPADEDVAPQDLEQKHDVVSPEEPQPSQDQLNTSQTDQTAESKSNQERQKPQPPHTNTTNITYTVQTGAFKSESDAHTLKEKLDKKGYTAYIIQSETKKHESLYKVMIGEFRTRKEAEVLSIKIKKAEGLQAFVTFRTQEDVLRSP
jgi:cell division septation protein DedD